MSKKYKPLVQLYNKGDSSDPFGTIGYSNAWGNLDRTDGSLYKIDLLSDWISRLIFLRERMLKEYHRVCEKQATKN